MNFFRNLGPGILVSAAFIGPGTVTVCSLAGVNFGYSLLWALVISIFACMVLQEMAARLGLITGEGLSDVIRKNIQGKFARFLTLLLIFSAIVVGNAAYEAGNISGAVLGAETLFPGKNLGFGNLQINLWSILIGSFAFILLFLGSYKKLETAFIILVVLMSIVFVVTAVVAQPDLSLLFEGFIPGKFDEGLLTIIALVGTTVVPYNLFLHASLVSEKWKKEKFLGIARKELVFSIGLGGLVSMAILICAASSNLTNIQNAGDLAVGLQPLFGESAKYLLAIGLLAAGITSSITAPLAAAYVVKGCLGWKDGIGSRKFQSVWISILLLGIIFSSLGIKPVEIIKFAQIANGLVLPIIAIFLFYMVNKSSILGKYKNTLIQNIAGIMVILLSFFLGVKSIYSVITSF